MSSKTKSSITTEFIRVEGKPAWLVRGFTTGIKEILLADGATWDGQRIGWVYVGQTLPAGIKQAIDSVLGKVDPAAPPPALKPVAVLQSSPSHPVATVEGAAVKLAAKFRDWGSRLQKEMDHKLRPWGDAAPTHKRIGEYKSRIADGLELQLFQDRLYAIATGLEAGTLPDSLAGVKDKTLVQRLAKRELPPRLFIYANEAKALIEANADVPALLDGVHRLQAEAGQFDDHKTHFGQDTLADLLAVLNLCGSGIASGLRDRIERWQVAAAARIEEPQRWTDAVAALEAISHPQAGKLTKELELQFARLDIAQSSIPGYFPTPPNVVAHMLSYFKPQPGDTVLEPSAGSGHIAEAIRQRHPEMDVKVIEWNLSLCHILQL